MHSFKSEDLSIVVAAYGDVPYLEETLTSAVNTQPSEVEIIVLDDASPTSQVSEIAKKFADRIKYIRNDKNLGVSGAFNEAAREVSRPLLMLLGPDDRLTNSVIDALNRASFDLSDLAAIQPGVQVIDSSGELFNPLTDNIKRLVAPKKLGLISSKNLATSLVKGNWTYNPSLIWNVEILRKFKYDENLKTAMDLDLLLRLSFAGERIGILDRYIFEYRRHDGAVSSQNAGLQRLSEELLIHQKAAIETRTRKWISAYIWAQIAPTARVHALKLIRSGTFREKVRLLKLAFTPVRFVAKIR